MSEKDLKDISKALVTPDDFVTDLDFSLEDFRPIQMNGLHQMCAIRAVRLSNEKIRRRLAGCREVTLPDGTRARAVVMKRVTGRGRA